MPQSPSLRQRLLLALAGAALLLGVLAATARAGEYGGLGGLAVFKPGKNGGHLEVNPRGNRAFGVAPDGSSYIAEEIEIAGKPYFRIQKLGSKGEYLAEARVKLAGKPYQLEGVAIDAEGQRLYVLVVGERKTEEEQPVFDPEAPVAAELYAFSTQVDAAGELEPAAGTTAGLLAGEKALGSLSEEAGVPLLHPHGIAVDPTTHDVLILGQQDISTKKGLGEADLRAAVQRVHSNGSLGPRYIDGENCLDEGAVIAAEPACAEGFGQPSSPFVSPGGRLYGERPSERGPGELWEIPATEGAAEAFEPGSHPKVYEAKPKRLFTIGRGQGIEGQESIVEPVSEEEGAGGALAFVPTGSGEGKLYLDAEITAEEGEGRRSQSRGAVVLGYSESGATPSAKELGWTAGQNATGEDTKCILPPGTSQILLGADGSGRLLLFDVTTAVLAEHKPATVSVLQFGAGGEECGHARATPPSVSVLGETVTKLPKGKTASLSLNVFAADALSVEWRFKDNGKEEAGEPPVVEAYPFPTQVPTSTHEFKHGGNYEVVAVVEPDDFGPKIEVHSNVTVEGGEETKQEEEAKQKREEEEKKEAEAKKHREEEEQKEAEAKKHREEEEQKEAEAKKHREEEEKKEIEEGKEEEVKKHREEEEKKEAEVKKHREEEEKKEAEVKKHREEEEQKEAEAKKHREEEEQKEAEERGVPIGAEFSYTSPATVSQPAKFAAKVTDPNNKASPHAQYKYEWEFGDGAKAEGSGTREFRAEHAYASEGRYEVKLEVTDEGGRTTAETHVVQVNIPRTLASIASLGAAAGGSGNSGGGGGGGGVSGAASTSLPGVTLAGTSLAVSGSGAVTLKLACPAGEASCSGTVTLRTLGAVKASTHGRKHVLTLAAGSFTVVGGRVKAVTLHLSAEARALLARAHVLRVRATLEAHDPAGATHTTQAVVTLRLGKPLRRR